jgi:biopolymer transport protein ExbD
MAFGGFNKTGDTAPMAEINMVPLIDVMLVLLVIFIVTAPLLTHSVKIDLPKASSTPNIARPQNVQLAVDREGRVHWNGEVVDESAWRSRMQAAAAQDPQPEVQLRGDSSVAYGKVVRVLSDAARLGLTHIGFVTDPGEAAQ